MYAGIRRKKRKDSERDSDRRKKEKEKEKRKDGKKKDGDQVDHLDVGANMDVTNIRVGDYQMVEAIGKGGFGTVYRALNLKTGETVAVKRVSLHGIPAEELEGIEMEIKLLKNLIHPNIVKYVDAIRQDEFLNIVLEFVENGALSSMVAKLLKRGHVEEQLVAVYAAQILEGLRYLHQQGVIHRDIKGANILSTKNAVVKLADFGVATRLNESKKSDSVVGTPYWMAPEIIEMTGQQSAACDIWSVGCTVVELITGKPPYFDLQQMPALFRIVQDEHPPLPDNISPALEDFLMECFKKDPLQRVTAAKLLKHAWLKSAVDEAAQRQSQQSTFAPYSHPSKTKPTPAPAPGPVPSDSGDLEARMRRKAAASQLDDEDMDWGDDDDDDNTEAPATAVLNLPAGTVPSTGTVPGSVNMAMVGTAQLSSEWVEDDEDDDIGVDLENVELDLTRVKNKSKAWDDVRKRVGSMSGDAEEEDVFADMEFDAPDLRSDQDALLTKRFMRMISKLSQKEEEETIIDTCKQLQRLLAEEPELTKQLMTQHGVIPVMEMLEVFNPVVIVAVLKLVNLVIGEDQKFQQNMSLVGLIPAIIRFASPGFPANIRLEAANFVRHFSYASDFTRKMFIACGGLPVLVGFLEEPYAESKTLVFNAIDCIRHVFEVTSNPKNDFCRLFCKYGLLAPLANALVHVNNDKQHPDAMEYTLKTANVVHLFSNGDATVKSYLAKPQVMEMLLKALPDMPHEVLNLILKSIRNISMEPSTLDLLESAGAIPALMPYLNSQFPDIQNQVLLSMYYLSTISVNRQEQAVRAGLVPHLQRFIRQNHPLKQFAFPIIFQLAKGSRSTRMELKKYNGVNFFLDLLKEPYWRTHALDALAVWLGSDTTRVEFSLMKNPSITKLVNVFRTTTTTSQVESLIASFSKILASSRRVGVALGNSYVFVEELVQRLQAHENNNNIRKSVLKAMQLVYDYQRSKLQFAKRHQLVPVLRNVAKDKSAVVVSPLAVALLKAIEDAQAGDVSESKQQ